MNAPLALFVYKRPDHTARTITALKACDGFARTPVTVFSDGAKLEADKAAVAAVRALVAAELPAATLVAAPSNHGLAASIIAGVDDLVRRHGRVIVIEDDLLVATDFLSYMNAGLERFADDARVMQVSGYMFDVQIGAAAVFLPFTTSWGWGTWDRAWRRFDPDAEGSGALATDAGLRHRFNLDGVYRYDKMLDQQRAGKVDSWAIRWYWSVFQAGGLVLYPPRSLVYNDGFDDTATHTRHRLWRRSKPREIPEPLLGLIYPNAIAADATAYSRIKRYLGWRRSLWFRLAGAVASLLPPARALR